MQETIRCIEHKHCWLKLTAYTFPIKFLPFFAAAAEEAKLEHRIGILQRRSTPGY